MIGSARLQRTTAIGRQGGKTPSNSHLEAQLLRGLGFVSVAAELPAKRGEHLAKCLFDVALGVADFLDSR